MSVKKQRILAVIPARSGSKRLKNKNILPVAGKPMIAYTIEAALKSKIYEDVLVSTDSERIARIARRYGAVVPFLRERKLADDHTPVSLATCHALEQMQKHTGKIYDTVAQLMPNCPCRKAKDIIQAHQQFAATKAKFQISVFPFGFMNPWWAMRIKGKNVPVAVFPQAYKKRSQDLEKLYCPTGALWLANAKALQKEKTFYAKGYRVFIMDWKRALDIDDKEDLAMAQMVMRLYA